MSEKELTTKEAARLLKVSISTIRRWTDSNLIPHTRTKGNHRRFQKDLLIEHYKQLKYPKGITIKSR